MSKLSDTSFHWYVTPGLALIAPRATGDGSCPIHSPGNEDVIASELTPRTFLGSGKTSLFVRVANWEALMCKLQSSSCWKYLPPIDTEFGSALRRQMRRVLFSTLPPHLDFALPQSSHPPPDVLSSSVSVTIDCRWNLQWRSFGFSILISKIIMKNYILRNNLWDCLLTKWVNSVNRVSKIMAPTV